MNVFFPASFEYELSLTYSRNMAVTKQPCPEVQVHMLSFWESQQKEV